MNTGDSDSRDKICLCFTFPDYKQAAIRRSLLLKSGQHIFIIHHKKGSGTSAGVAHKDN